MDSTGTALQGHAGSPTFSPSSSRGWAEPEGCQGNMETLQRCLFHPGGYKIDVSHTVQLLSSFQDAAWNTSPCLGLSAPLHKVFLSAHKF